jgi:hypothetical protein
MTSANVYRIVAGLMICCIGAHHFATMRAPVGVAQYDQLIQASAEKVPANLGIWFGRDEKVPNQAVSTLRPNVLISRTFTNIENNLHAGVLLVHCADAHHMVGHYPLRCYPLQGWQLQASEARRWMAGDLPLDGMEYRFTRPAEVPGAPDESIVVANCLFRPNGKVLRDMDALSKSIVGAAGPMLGAGQLQIYFDSTIPRQQRDEAVARLANGYRPVLDAILSNPTN